MHRIDRCNWLREKVICDPFPRLVDCSKMPCCLISYCHTLCRSLQIMLCCTCNWPSLIQKEIYVIKFSLCMVNSYRRKKTVCVESFHSHFGEWKPCENGGQSYVLLEMFTYGSDSLRDLCLTPQPVAKMLRHSNEKPSLFTSNLCYSNFCTIKYSPPPYSPFKVVPPIFEHGLVSLATLKRRDHKHKIMARPFKPQKVQWL